MFVAGSPFSPIRTLFELRGMTRRGGSARRAVVGKTLTAHSGMQLRRNFITCSMHPRFTAVALHHGLAQHFRILPMRV